MILGKVLRVVGITVVITLSITLPAVAATVEYQFFPEKSVPISQGWGIDQSGGGTESVGSDALVITDVSASLGGVTYLISHGGTQPFPFECRAVAKITSYTDPSTRAIFFIEYVTGRATYGRVIRAGMALTPGGNVRAGFVGQDGEWIGATYTTPGANLGFVELFMQKDFYATTGLVSLFVNGVDTGVTVLNNDTAFQPIGSLAIQNFRFGTIGDLPGANVPTGEVKVVGASCGNIGDSAPGISIPALCTSYPSSDANGDCQVNMLDFAILSFEWMTCGLLEQVDCWP